MHNKKIPIIEIIIDVFLSFVVWGIKTDYFESSAILHSIYNL